MSIKLQNISFTYHRGTPFARQALENVDLCLDQHEVLGILGGTGSGKSTLLQMMVGLLKPDKGRITIDDLDISQYMKERSSILHHKIGMVFQNPEEQIFEKTVFAEIAFGLKKRDCPTDEMAGRVEQALENVGLSSAFYQRLTYTLSSGEKRRVAIASVLALEPEYILFDEPTAGLDYEGRVRLLEYIKSLHRDKKAGIIIVSHDPNELFQVCQRMIFLKAGRVLFLGDHQAWLDQYEALCAQGMVFPNYQQVIYGLKQRGWQLPGQATSFAEAAQEIIRCYREQ